MGGKYIFYNSHCFPSDSSNSEYQNPKFIHHADECPKYPDGTYYCSHLSYSNYSNTKYLTFNFGIEKSPPGYHIDDRNMNIYIFNCVIDGKGTFNGRPFGKGMCYYSKVRQNHSMYSDKREPWVSVWFSIDGSVGKEIADRLDEKHPDQMFTFSYPEELLRFAECMLYDFKHVQNTAEYIDGIIHLLMTFLDPDPDVAFSDSGKFTLHQRKVIRQSIVTIEKNLSTITVAGLAEEAHWEVKYFSKIFTLVTGITPKEYLIRTKMEMAAHYLVDTTYSIEDITSLLGYKHRNCLNAIFKQTYGMNPSEYRRLHTKKQ